MPQPNATPAQASHRGLARRPSRNAAFAASRQARFSHGSSSSVRPESTSAGYTASSPAVTAQAITPRCLTSRPASGTQAVLASTLRMRAAASPVACDVSDPRAAPGSATTMMPGGWRNA